VKIQSHAVIGYVLAHLGCFLSSLVTIPLISTPLILIYRFLSRRTHSRHRQGAEAIIFSTVIFVVTLKIFVLDALAISMFYDILVGYLFSLLWTRDSKKSVKEPY